MLCEQLAYWFALRAYNSSAKRLTALLHRAHIRLEVFLFDNSQWYQSMFYLLQQIWAGHLTIKFYIRNIKVLNFAIHTSHILKLRYVRYFNILIAPPRMTSYMEHADDCTCIMRSVRWLLSLNLCHQVFMHSENACDIIFKWKNRKWEKAHNTHDMYKTNLSTRLD